MTFTGGDVALIITAVSSLIAAIGTLLNAWNIRRIETNTNSISSRNEAIAKKLGIAEGKAAEQDAQAAREK